MNIFRLGADMMHVLSLFLLIFKIIQSKSVEGISRKTQEIYLGVFLTRYLDLIFYPHSFSFLDIYNSIMKIIFIGTASTVVYYFRFKEPWKTTYKSEEDSFLHLRFAVLPCAVLALVINSAFSPIEILWTFSVYLEAIAVLPQLILIQRYGNVENLTANLIFTLGAYRALYVVNWIDRWLNEDNYLASKVHWITFISGVIQTALYCDFFYYYIQSRHKGRMMLPK